MEPVIAGKLTSKCQTTIPEKIRGILDLHPGDSVAFEVTPDKKVFLRIKYGEIELAQMVKSLGGQWNRQKQLRELPWRQVQLLKLEDRIVKIE